ncbi:uncharacterized protein STEHIDRAFT_153820 [Stereum hirsutum FP-91666 SS1]|uniref:uncharacterized protein n=1 Tax=Stereum hirsutum (strain FP-91666) TaxID=721885 RepID=UPI000440B03B|nr:uncharacterized protein STEHIDRAFT_153820 [Stereum hirsutum FP-91666 SS1]EIM89983.1 hypothetical protein STEHIDRAFT_153820 [Stereum hirsutum FP-91666 SS1]
MATLPRPKDTYAGRSVEVRESEFNVALTKLKNIVSRNRVRREAQDQRRHEKKGYKRRRLASVRWRKRFAYEVRKKIQLVNAIRARGA